MRLAGGDEKGCVPVPLTVRKSTPDPLQPPDAAAGGLRVEDLDLLGSLTGVEQGALHGLAGMAGATSAR